MSDRYINPFTDFGFKKLFGEEANKDLLIDFLNSLLFDEHKIVDLSFKKTENLGSTELNRKAIFDLYCIDDKEQRFIVELQKAEQKFFKDRTIYYSTFPIQEQAKKGNWSYKLEPVYCIGILDFVFDEDKENPDKYFYRVALSDTETNKLFYDKLFYIYLEVPKFNKSENELVTNTDKWLYFLKNLSRLDEIPNSLRTEMFIKAFNLAEIANFSEDQKYAYEESMKYYRDLKNVLDKKYDDGKVEGELIGIQKGELIGIQKGELIGIQKGKVEGKLNQTKELLIRLLEKKFNEKVSKKVETEINNIQDIAIIENAVECIFDLDKITDVLNILKHK